MENQYSNENIIQLLSLYTLAAFRLIPILNRFLGHMQRFKHSYPSMNKLIIENEQKIVLKKMKMVKLLLSYGLKSFFGMKTRIVI